MKFGEKVKKLRKDHKLTQEELAKLVGVSIRTIVSYEKCISFPRYREVYKALADALDTSVEFLINESEEFMAEVGQQYGSRGQRQAADILEQARNLFAGGELSEADEIAFLTEMQQLFLDSKERAKKYTPKKYKENV